MSVDAEAIVVHERRMLGRLTTSGLTRAAPRAARDLMHVLLAVVAVVATYRWLEWGIEQDVIGFDFRGTLWDPGVAIREGRSPYPAPVASELEVGNPALYPPFLMFLVAPLTVAPWAIGFAVWTGILVAALAVSLYALGVRDPRCYAIAAISAPAMGSFLFGNATLLLVPLVALAWRWRGHALRSGVLVGVAIAAKLFLWPLFLWLLGTRRYRAAGYAAAAAAFALLVPWAILGFEGLRSYPDLLRAANDVFASHSFSVATMLSALGIDSSTASWAAVAAGGVVAIAAFHFGRRGNEHAALSLAVLAAVIGSPILWAYYYALLFVPLAIVRPRFSGLWAALPLLWLGLWIPREGPSPSDLLEGGAACCRPPSVPGAVWQFNHSPPGLWPALGLAIPAIVVLLIGLRSKPAASGP